MRAKLTKRVVEAIQPAPARDVIAWDTELRGFGVRVWPSGKRAYFVKYRTQEGRQRKPTIGVHGIITAEQARDHARQWLAEAAGGSDPANRKREAREMPTMAELAELYLARHARPPKKKPSSIANDRRLLAKRIVPPLGRRKVNEVTREDVVRLQENLQETPYEANRVLALLSKMFTLAEDWGFRSRPSNPCKGIDRFPEKRRQRFLGAADLARLGVVIAEEESKRTHSPSVFAAVKLLLFTGCRLSEILTLRWTEVDLERSCLRLADSKESKTGEKVVFLNSAALEVLSALKPEHGNAYVISGAKAGRHLVNLEKPWRRLRDKAGLNGVRLHDLRHSFASAGAENGLSLPLIGALLGHRQPTTTNRYIHVGADPLREANELVGQYLAAKLAPADAAPRAPAWPAGDPDARDGESRRALGAKNRG
jgi:integrase